MFKKRKSRHALIPLFVVIGSLFIILSLSARAEVVPRNLGLSCRGSSELVIRSTNLNPGTYVCLYEADENNPNERGDLLPRCTTANDCGVAAIDISNYYDLQEGKYWIWPCNDVQGCSFNLGYYSGCPEKCLNEETGCSSPLCNTGYVCVGTVCRRWTDTEVSKDVREFPYGDYSRWMYKHDNGNSGNDVLQKAIIGCGASSCVDNVGKGHHMTLTEDFKYADADPIDEVGSHAFYFFPEGKDPGESAGLHCAEGLLDSLDPISYRITADDNLAINAFPDGELPTTSQGYANTRIFEDMKDFSGTRDYDSSQFWGVWTEYTDGRPYGWVRMRFAAIDGSNDGKVWLAVNMIDDTVAYYFPAIDSSQEHSFMHLDEGSVPAHCFDGIDNDGDWSPVEYVEGANIYDPEIHNARSDVGTDGCSDWYEGGDDVCLNERRSLSDVQANPDPNGDNFHPTTNEDGTEGNGVPDLGERFLDCRDPQCYGKMFDGNICPNADGSLPEICSLDVKSDLENLGEYDPASLNGSDACCGDDQEGSAVYARMGYEHTTDICYVNTLCYKETTWTDGDFTKKINISTSLNSIQGQLCEVLTADLNNNTNIAWNCFDLTLGSEILFADADDPGYIVNTLDRGWLCADHEEYMLYDGRNPQNNDNTKTCSSFEYGFTDGEACQLTDDAQDWRWERADRHPYKILTYSVDNSAVYDVVSSGKNWVRCNPGATMNLENTMTDLQLLNEVTGIVTDEDGEDIDTGGTSDGAGSAGEIVVGGHDIDVEGGSGQETTSQGYSEVLEIKPIEISKAVKTNVEIEGIRGFESGTIFSGGLLIKSENSTHGENQNEITVSSEGFEKVKINVDPEGTDDNTFDIELTYTTGEGTQKTIVYEDAITVVGVGIRPDQEVAERFICYREAARSSIAECAGFTLGSSKNDIYHRTENPYPKTFRSGESLHTLYDFYIGDPNAENEVVPDANGYLLTYHPSAVTASTKWQRFFPLRNPQKSTTPPLRITDWRSYDALEFDIYFSSTEKIRLAIYSEQVAAQSNSQDWSDFVQGGDLDNPIFDDYISKYSVDGNELLKWHRIKVPLRGYGKRDNIESVGLMKFYFDGAEVAEDIQTKWRMARPVKSEIVAQQENGDPWVSVMTMIDRIHLTSSSDTKSVCSGSRTWIEGYDDYNACVDVEPFGWVTDTSLDSGGLCCGEDHSSEDREYFESSQGGSSACWNGITMGDGTAFSNVNIKLNGVEYNLTCTGKHQFDGSQSTCIYPVPADRQESEIYLANPYPGVYSANWGYAQDEEFITEQDTITENRDKFIIVQLKKKEVISAGGEFWGCWPSDLNSQHIQAGNVITEACAIKAGHFCSPNRGWVPFSGTADELYPKNAPPGVNLVPNGGFEE